MTQELREISQKRQVTDRTDARPFASQWLDSAYQETVLHNAPWDPVKKRICDALAQKIEKQRDEPERMQMIFELVGTEFKNFYFPDITYEPFLLKQPNLNNEQVAKLRGEAQSWLNVQAQKVSKDVGCGRVPPGTAPTDDLCKDQLEFLQNTYEIFLKNLDRYMVQQELEESEKLHNKQLENERLEKEQEEKAKVQVVYRSASTVSSVPSSAMSRKDTTLTEKIRKMVGPEPVYHCFQTEKVALSVKQILQRDPKRFVDVAQRLHGRQLGRTLRTYCWLDVLFKSDRDSLREGNVEKLVRSRFINHVRRGVVDLSLKSATHSPISGLIENAVVETYSKTLAMHYFNSDDHLKDAARALNVLYVYDRTYEPYLVHWVFPLQLALREHAGTPEFVYELAMYLDLLNQSCFPSWPKIFAKADKTLLRLENIDKELYDHLKVICLEDIEVDPKEFMVYLIHEEREKAQALLNNPPSSAESYRMSKELLADALIFLRKWMGEGFVSVLDTPAVLFIWDQNFLQFWQGESMENLCLTLLELLRYKFMEAKNYKEMKHVFLTEPGKLYTADIQRAWIHIERGGNPFEVQYFNRQRPITKPRAITEDIESLKTPLKFVKEGQLQNFGVKNIRIKLVIPADKFYKEVWLAQFEAENMKMMFLLYFADKKIAHRLTTVTPTVRFSTQSEGKDRIILLEYQNDVLLFDQDALMEKHDVLEDSIPFIAFRIDYLQVTGKLVVPIPLAWGRVDTHSRKPEQVQGKYVAKENELFDWIVNPRQVNIEMFEGLMPQCVLDLPPRIPPKSNRLLISASSQTQLTIFYDVTPQGSPQTVSEETKSPTPAPSVKSTPQPQHQHFVYHNPSASEEDTQMSIELNEPFDLYIDAIRFLPDNATIVKITGRFLKTGEVTNIPDIAAFPESYSDPRNPVFNFRMVVNDSRHELNPECLLILRIYTVDKFTKDLVVIGSCLLDCIRDNRINTGGFQLKLHNGMPDITRGITTLTSGSMDNIPRIPSTTILARILPHEPGYRAMPDYLIGYYNSLQFSPNQSEYCIFDRFYNDKKNDWVRIINKIKKDENDPSETNELSVQPYMQERLDPKRYLPPMTPAGNLDLKQCVKYRKEAGFRVKIQAFGLPDGLWCQCVLKVKLKPTRREQTEKKITMKLDYTSAQKAPRWLDELKFYPSYDSNSFLVIELYGLKFQYKNKPEPKLLNVKGQKLGEQDLTNGFAIVPLYLNESLLTGSHLVPIFKGLPNSELLDRLATNSVKSIKSEQLSKLQNACFLIKLVDLHFFEEEFPLQPLPTYQKIVELVGDSGYSKVSKDESGKVLTDIVLRALPSDQAKAGPFGEKFQREKDTFDRTAQDAIIEMMKLKKSLP